MALTNPIIPPTPATTVTAIAPKDTHASVWPSESAASRAYDVASFGLIAGLAIGVVSTVLIVWMGNVKETYLRLSLSAATAGAADASNRAASADKAAAEANERAAKAELETARIKASIAPRFLSGEQREKLIAAIRGKLSVDVRVENLSTDVEAYPYAQQFLEALKAAGVSAEWQTFPYPFFWFNEPGIYVWEGGPDVEDQGEALKDALASAGIHAVITKPGKDQQASPTPWIALVVWGRKPPDLPSEGK